MKAIMSLQAVLLLIIVIGAVGWIKNLIKLTDCDFVAPYKCEVVHVVGIVPPVGAVTGWLDMGK